MKRRVFFKILGGLGLSSEPGEWIEEDRASEKEKRHDAIDCLVIR